MLVRADMVGRKICENGGGKLRFVNAVVLESQRGNFNGRSLAAAVRHNAQKLLQLVAFRRGVHCRQDGIAAFCSDGADDSAFYSCRLKDGLDDMGNGGFALCSGNADNGNFL